MQIFLSPELVREDKQIINVIDQSGKAVGYLTFLLDEKKMYVHGILENEEVSADFKDIVKPYIQGMAKSKPDLDIYSYLSLCGKKIELEIKSK